MKCIVTVHVIGSCSQTLAAPRSIGCMFEDYSNECRASRGRMEMGMSGERIWERGGRGC